MKRCPALLLAAVSLLGGCASEHWRTEQLSSGRYQLIHTGGGRAEALRPAFGQRAEKLCRHGYQLSEPQVIGEGWHGNAVFGEGPNWTVRAEVRCNEQSAQALEKQPATDSSKANPDMP